MVKRSAGLLLFRRISGEVEVFLVHPGGPFWVRKDEGAWSIPKGEYSEDEDPLLAAKREFAEETGLHVEGAFTPLGEIRQPGGKTVVAWALEYDLDASTITSNTFGMEWPPRSGKTQEFPEVDKGAWFSITQARRKILKGQLALLEKLEARPGRLH